MASSLASLSGKVREDAMGLPLSHRLRRMVETTMHYYYRSVQDCKTGIPQGQPAYPTQFHQSRMDPRKGSFQRVTACWQSCRACSDLSKQSRFDSRLATDSSSKRFRLFSPHSVRVHLRFRLFVLYDHYATHARCGSGGGEHDVSVTATTTYSRTGASRGSA